MELMEGAEGPRADLHKEFKLASKLAAKLSFQSSLELTGIKPSLVSQRFAVNSTYRHVVCCGQLSFLLYQVSSLFILSESQSFSLWEDDEINAQLLLMVVKILISFP